MYNVLVLIRRNSTVRQVLVVFSFLIFLASPLRAQHPDTSFYSVVKNHEKAGYMKLWKSDPHRFFSSYKYNDRGRGDSVVTEIATNDSGLIVRLETNGVDYFKKPYHELYMVVKDSAIGLVNDDRRAKLFKGELFQSAEPTDVEPGTQFLLRRPNQSFPLFSGGTMMMVPPHEKTVSLNGTTVKLLLCEFYFNQNQPPNFVWFDSDAHLFASVSDWFSTIRNGYEPLVDTLNILQLMESKGYFSKQMKSLADTLPAAFAIQHVRLFDAEHAVMLEDMTVTIQDGKVHSVGTSVSVQIPKEFSVIDGTHKTLLPGLWDMHGHYQEAEGLNYLAGGVTHVRDMGNGRRLPAVRDAIRNNDLLGPDISYMSGFIDRAGPFQGPTGAIVHDLMQGLTAIDDYAKLGYQQIKLYSSVDPAWVAPLAARAHHFGMRLCGHIPAFMTAEQAVDAGYDEITHMNMVMLNFQGDSIDTRAMRRFSAVGERGVNLDLNGDAVSRFVGMLRRKQVSLDPTMNVFAGMFTVFPGDTDAATKPILAWMPADQRVNVAAQSSFVPVSEKPVYTASFAKMLEMLKKLYDNGILIVAGTDGGDAFALEHELELYVGAGIPPLNALQCATYNGAKDCSLLNDYGTISAGKPADMILVDGNPAVTIGDIRRVEWVIKNDRQFYPKKLFASIGWSYYY
jgi:hypothetical protein